MGRPLVLISGKDVISRVGGHASYVRAHGLAAIRIGFEPHIFEVSRVAGTTRTDFGVVHRIATPHRLTAPIVLQIPVLARAVTGFLGRNPGCPLIHGFGIWAAAAVDASRALARCGVPSVPIASAYGTRAYEEGALLRGMRPHHPLPRRLRYRAWVRWIRALDDPLEGRGYLGSKLVLVNYESVERILAHAYGPEIAVRRIPYTSPHAFGAGAGLAQQVPQELAGLAPADAPLVLSVSRHDPRKGLDVLLFALADLAASGVPFRACLAGNGEMLHAHRRLAVALGLEGRAVLPGRIEDPRPYLASADVFALPSLAEASGSVSVVEALQSGTAVIASACDGIPEDLTDGLDALLVSPGDSRALGDGLRRLLTDRSLRERLAAGGLGTHERRFSADRFVDALADVYAEVEAGDGTGSAAARTASATYAMSSSERRGPDGR